MRLEAIHKFSHRDRMVPYLFANHEMLLWPCGTLFWPEEQALLVADLHFEKSRFFARHGQFLPPYDSYETAVQLADRIKRTGAKKLICLGDSFHDDDGAATMDLAALAFLRELATHVEWIWVRGNHDCGAAFPIGRSTGEMQLRGITLCHEASVNRPEPEISGHFHPKIKLSHRGHSVSRRCFLASDTKLVLPAFGTLTGGLDAAHPAIHAAFGGAITAIIPVEDRLLRFPVPAPVEHCL